MRKHLGGACLRVCLSRVISGVAFVLLLAAVPTFAQSNGTILGIVKDSTGGTVPDAQVTVTNMDTAAVRTTTTGSDGGYRVPALQPGRYSVKVEKSGFKTMTQAGITLDVAAEITVNASLEVGSSTQEVTVTGEAALVETSSSSLAGLINDQKMAELPLNGRNFIDLALLQPGVNNYTNLQKTNAQGGIGGVVFSSNGAPVRSNTFTIDGANMMNLEQTAGGGTGTTMGVDGIKEFKVITSAFGAEFGQQMGSQVVLVSKSGGNQFHGDVYDYFRNSALDARNFFDYTYQDTGKRLPILQRNDFGGAIGGPIRKDKTFFYGVFENLRAVQGQTIIDSVFGSNCYDATPQHNLIMTNNPCAISTINPVNPTGTVNTYNNIVPTLFSLYPYPNVGTNGYAFTFPAPTDIYFGQMRIDHNFSTNDSLFVRYTIQDPYNTGANVYPQIILNSSGRDQFVTVGENHIFSPTLLNSVRLSFSRTNVQQIENLSANLNSPSPAFSLVTGYDIGQIAFNAGPSSFNQTNAPSRLLQNIYTLSDDVYVTKGKHAFKFGGLFNRYEDFLNSSNGTRGVLTFSAPVNFFAGNYSNGTYFSAYNGGKQPLFYTLGFYGQDDWRVTQRLTLNLGLRYEFNTNLTDRLGNAWAFVPSLIATSTPTNGAYTRNPSYRNFSPRVGFAWDVFGNGKTSVRSAFGMYYDLANYGFQIYGTANGQPPLTNQSTIAGSTFGTATTGGVISGLPISSIPGAGGKSLSNLEYNINQPTILQWNLTIEQQLTPNLSLSVAYVGTRGTHLWDQEEGNPCYPLSITNGIPFWGGAGLTSGDQCPASPLNPSNTSNGRANGAFINAGLRATNGDSHYNGLQAVLTKRVSRGLQFVGAYTYSKVIDDDQGQFGPSECTPVQGNTAGANDVYSPNRRFDTGPACFDSTHNIQATALYHLPGIKSGNALERGVMNGWWTGALVSWQTGQPFSVIEGNSRSDSANLGPSGGDHLDYGAATFTPACTPATMTTPATGICALATTPTTTLGQPFTFVPYNASTVIIGSPNQWFNPLMFTPSQPGYLGTTSRNVLRGPHLSNLNISFNKDTAAHFLGEAGQIEFRAEFFNMFNHANFGMPNSAAYGGSKAGNFGEAPAASAGLITNTITTSRQIQLSLKILF